MIQAVPAEDIEQIVGQRRWHYEHVGFWRANEDRIFILHSYECLEQHPDLTLCPYSIALENNRYSGPWASGDPYLLELAGEGTSRVKRLKQSMRLRRTIG